MHLVWLLLLLFREASLNCCSSLLTLLMKPSDLRSRVNEPLLYYDRWLSMKTTECVQWNWYWYLMNDEPYCVMITLLVLCCDFMLWFHRLGYFTTSYVSSVNKNESQRDAQQNIENSQKSKLLRWCGHRFWTISTDQSQINVYKYSTWHKALAYK